MNYGDLLAGVLIRRVCLFKVFHYCHQIPFVSEPIYGQRSGLSTNWAGAGQYWSIKGTLKGGGGRGVGGLDAFKEVQSPTLLRVLMSLPSPTTGPGRMPSSAEAPQGFLYIRDSEGSVSA